MGRRAHKPDPAQRRQVETLAAYGIPADNISRIVSIDPKTLRKHYREELDLGEAKANAQVAGFLFNSAKNGNVAAQIFWLKTRARWRETPVEMRHSGAIARADLSALSDGELMTMVASLAEQVGFEPVRTIPSDGSSPNAHPLLTLVPNSEQNTEGEATSPAATGACANATTIPSG